MKSCAAFKEVTAGSRKVALEICTRKVIYSKENSALGVGKGCRVQKGYASKGKFFFSVVRGPVNKKRRVEFVSVCKISSKE